MNVKKSAAAALSAAFLWTGGRAAASDEADKHQAGLRFDGSAILLAEAPPPVLAQAKGVTAKASPIEAGPVQAPGKRYLLDRAGDIGFLQLYADGFESLPPEQRVLAYHLSEAAKAGRDIIFDQTHRDGLAVKRLLEGILEHRAALEQGGVAGFGKIRAFCMRFWANNGNHDSQTGRKFVPEFTYEELRAAAEAAKVDGAFKGMGPGELESELSRLQKTIFDPAFEPQLCDASPGKDVVATSALNLYEGVTQKEAEESNKGKPYPVVSRLSKRNGAVVEEVYRAGDPSRGIPPGRYARELGAMVSHLEAALPLVKAPLQRKSIEHLIAFFKSGDPADFRKYNLAWVHDDPAVDAILGFIETYLDPLGQRASFEGGISYKDRVFTSVIKKVADDAGYFERSAPWPKAYKKPKSAPVTANAVNMLTQTGASGEGMVLGVNLPNDEPIREKEGSKNIMISNAIDAGLRFSGSKIADEFAFDRREIDLNRKWAIEAYRLHVALHEVLGHASGRMSERLKGRNPSEYLKEYSSALEEARAELFALWAIGDPKLRSQGLVRSPEVVEQEYRAFVRDGGLVQLRKVPDGDTLTQAHARARNLIATYLRVKTGAVEAVERDGKTYLRVTGIAKMRRGVGELLGQIMRIKAEGDYAGAKALFETYGDRFDPAWRDQVAARYKTLDLPVRAVPVSPLLKPVTDAEGRIKDAKVEYPKRVEDWYLSR